ncbi:heme exporter protein CcmB [Adlercreutzia sp. ZJ154]|uniref:heme exporter protein CcmB n=1 Tax=Adlercreutzia sp. ZJ154 TaxID=2709790 RepID=UPI0013EBE374|nr:heme exporter protein CcmB [Adlercreutzia sp. ZJ154]
MSRTTDTPSKVERKHPSSFSQYKVLLTKDLLREVRTKEMLVSMGVYALLVIVVFGVALGFAAPGTDFLEVSGGLLWVMVVFTSLLGLNRSFSVEKECGCLEGLLLAPMDRGVIFLAKATSNLIFLLIVEVIAVPLFWLFFSSVALPAETAPLIALPLLVGSVGIAGVGTLLSTITTNVKGKDVMLALLFIPVVFPLLYACVAATVAVLVGGDVMAESFATPLALAALYDVVMILISWFLYDFVVS